MSHEWRESGKFESQRKNWKCKLNGRNEIKSIIKVINCHKQMQYFILICDHEYDHNEHKNIHNYLLSINYNNIRVYLLNISLVTIVPQYLGFWGLWQFCPLVGWCMVNFYRLTTFIIHDTRKNFRNFSGNMVNETNLVHEK